MRVDLFLRTDPRTLVAHLADADARRFRDNEPQQVRAWEVTIACLRTALAEWPAAAGWELVFEYEMLRLGRRIDAVLVTPLAVLVLEFKAGATRFDAGDRRQAWDYALDLQDFHAASRDHPVVPILVATAAASAPIAWPLLLAGVTTVLEASAASLQPLLHGLWDRLPATTPLAVSAWADAPYRPVPGIIEAARSLYARNSVADIANAGALRQNLGTTTDAILAAIA